MSGQSPITGSLFAPFFFPLGIAFMGAQSAVMMKMAGENWQYGKRRISAMSNEDFNKMTPIKLYQIETEELRAIIPAIESSLRTMTPLTATIVTEMLNTFKVGAQATGAYLQDIVKASGPIGNIIMGAITVWMPWLVPLLDVVKIPDFTPDPVDTTPATDTFPDKKLPPPPSPTFKTDQQIADENDALKANIDKQTKDPLMVKYTKFLADLSAVNQRITKNNAKPASPNKVFQTKLLAGIKNSLVKGFDVFKKNNRAWLVNNNLS